MLVVQLASGQVIIEFAASSLFSKSDIQRYDCSSLVRSHAHFVSFKLCIMRYVYMASLYFCCPDEQYLLCVLIDHYFVFIRIVLGNVFDICIMDQVFCFITRKYNWCSKQNQNIFI